MLSLIYLAPVAVAVFATGIGVMRSNAARPDPVALLATGIGGIAFAVLAVSQHDPGVAPGDAVAGVALAGVMLGAVPVYVYFVLGRALARHQVALWLICAASAVPLVYYDLIGFLFVLDLVYCPPDAYECPV